MYNRITLLDNINKLEKELNKITNVQERRMILKKIMRLEFMLDKLDERTIN